MATAIFDAAAKFSKVIRVPLVAVSVVGFSGDLMYSGEQPRNKAAGRAVGGSFG